MVLNVVKKEQVSASTKHSIRTTNATIVLFWLAMPISHAYLSYNIHVNIYGHYCACTVMAGALHTHVQYTVGVGAQPGYMYVYVVYEL